MKPARFICVDGIRRPVPNVCPQCGCHAKRHGNAKSQKVRCINPRLPLCGWSATVFYDSPIYTTPIQGA